MESLILDKEQINIEADRRWGDILSTLAGDAFESVNGRNKGGPCVFCGGTDRAYKHKDFDSNGVICCRQCKGGDGYAVIMEVNGWDFQEVLARVAKHLGMFIGHPGLEIYKNGDRPPPKRKLEPRPEPPPDDDLPRRKKWIENIWDRTIEDDGRIKTFHKERGLYIPVPPTLRLIKEFPTHFSFDKDKDFGASRHPVIVAQYLFKGEMSGLHILYLDPVKPMKANVKVQRRTLRCVDNLAGSSIQLYETIPDEPLMICEGIESALAMREISNIPVWAAGPRNLMESILIPDYIKAVYIGVDKDLNNGGRESATALAERLYRDYELDFLGTTEPDIELTDGIEKVDWNDYLKRKKEGRI